MPSHPDSNLNFFADDTMIYSTSMNMNHAITKIQKHINTITPWLQDWKLTLNTNKSIAMKFGKNLKSTKFIKINNTDIPWSSTTKYLGVTLDSRLTFSKHISDITNKAKITRAALYPILNSRSPIPAKEKNQNL